jgi:hypothetical protein
MLGGIHKTGSCLGAMHPFCHLAFLLRQVAPVLWVVIEQLNGHRV